jgi:glycolate oxidase
MKLPGLITDPNTLAGLCHDEAEWAPAGTPFAAFRPQSTEDVQRAVRAAAEHNVPIVPRGAGTGLSGGANAIDGCLVLDLSRMNRIIEIDQDNLVAVVQPGVVNDDLKKAVAAQGLWYPPDPASSPWSTIGGNVATNAGGLCCLKYGVTRDYVLGLEVVMGGPVEYGTAVRLGRRTSKGVAGYDLTSLLVGSEGTLGVVTEITLRLMPPQPAPCTAVATFPTNAASTDAVLAITSAMRPAMLEYMDRYTINAVEDMLRMGLDRGAAALLVAQTDAEGATAERELAAIVAAFEAHGATEVFATTDEAEGREFVVARRAAIPAVERKGKLLLEDVGVPLPNLPALVAGVHRIAADRGIAVGLIAHAGDGNTHPLLVTDPTDPVNTRNGELAFGEIMDLAISLNGTITGEHGVGRLKKPWLVDQVGPDVIALTERIKHAFDPQGLLNPGVIV